jgi:hypothetical protein
MRKANILLLAVLFLAIGAGIFYIFASEGKNVSDPVSSAVTSTATPAPTATPEASPTAAPEATPTFEPTPVLTPIPSPTPSPEPTPTPHVDHTASGEFHSDTGAWINIVAKWKTLEEDGKVRLQIEAYVESYSLYYTSYNPENLVFTVDGKSYRTSHEPISVGDNDKTQTLLATQTVDIPVGCALSVDVTWFCAGLTYGNKQLESITASDTIHIP